LAYNKKIRVKTNRFKYVHVISLIEVFLIVDNMTRPLDVLDKAKGKRVIIKLKNGAEITGALQAFDLHLNIWLEEAEERKEDKQVKLGSTLVRGDTIIYISPE
jgi:small nuclear ribonucleoprotein (snRNP)-like protein